MIKFHFNGSPNPTKVALFLEELAITVTVMTLEAAQSQFRRDVLKGTP